MSRMLYQVLDDYKQDEYERGDFDKMMVLGLCRQLVRDGRVRFGGVGRVCERQGEVLG